MLPAVKLESLDLLGEECGKFFFVRLMLSYIYPGFLSNVITTEPSSVEFLELICSIIAPTLKVD